MFLRVVVQTSRSTLSIAEMSPIETMSPLMRLLRGGSGRRGVPSPPPQPPRPLRRSRRIGCSMAPDASFTFGEGFEPSVPREGNYATRLPPDRGSQVRISPLEGDGFEPSVP